MVNTLKKLYYCMVDEHGGYRKVPVGVVYASRCSKDSLKIIRNVLNIVMNSDNISDETKIFIGNRGVSIKDTNEIINDLRARVSDRIKDKLKPLPYNNTVSKIANDNKALSEVISEKFLSDLLYDNIPVKRDLNKLYSELISRFGVCDNNRGNLELNIDSSKAKKNDYCNNEEFFDILSSVECYVKQRREIIEDALNSNKEFVEYFNYLLNSKSLLDDDVVIDRERLLKFLRNEDYVTGYVEETEVYNTENNTEENIYNDYEDNESAKNESNNDELVDSMIKEELDKTEYGNKPDEYDYDDSEEIDFNEVLSSGELDEIESDNETESTDSGEESRLEDDFDDSNITM